MMHDLESDVRNEVEAVHRFFVDWFSGAAPEGAFESRFVDRLDPDMVFIPPAGARVGFDALVSSIRKGRGSNPDFRVAIRKVQVHRVLDDHIVATYEEWQRNALMSSPTDNGRIATVLFARAQSFRWLHIHETWLPDAVMAAGPYDF